MSFSNYARRVRDSSLPFGARVSSLRSCVEQYQPLGWHATLDFLEEAAGPYQHDEVALLRALDLLHRSRQSRHRAHLEYAERRRQEKGDGRRVPRATDPDPITVSLWFGDGAEAAALSALRHEFRPRGRVAAVRASSTPGARNLTAAVDACLAAGGELPHQQRAQVGELVVDLARRTSRPAYDTDPVAASTAQTMLRIARLVLAAGEPARPALLRCEVVDRMTDGFPGRLRVRLVDAAGRPWFFVDKEPVFALQGGGPLEPPALVHIRCHVVDAAPGGRRSTSNR